MTRKDLDTLWQKALTESIKDGEQFTRYHFAQLVAAAEREACAKVCEDLTLAHPGRADLTADQCAAAIRAKGRE
jgi:hypothetical protein